MNDNWPSVHEKREKEKKKHQFKRNNKKNLFTKNYEFYTNYDGIKCRSQGSSDAKVFQSEHKHTQKTNRPSQYIVKYHDDQFFLNVTRPIWERSNLMSIEMWNLFSPI